MSFRVDLHLLHLVVLSVALVPVLLENAPCIRSSLTKDPLTPCVYNGSNNCSLYNSYFSCMFTSVKGYCNMESAIIVSNAYARYYWPALGAMYNCSKDSFITEQFDDSCNVTNTADASDTIDNSTLAPPVTTVTLSGPTVIDRLWIEFYCVIMTSINDSQARFAVDFQFDGHLAADVPSFKVSTSNLTVTLHEKFLRGKLGTSLRCVVQSYWASTPTTLGSQRYSNSFFMALSPSVSNVAVRENAGNPQLIYIQSTLPITCHDAATAAATAPCNLTLDIKTAGDIGVRQAGLDTLQSCKYLLTEVTSPRDSWYYNASQALEVTAKGDPYVTSTRVSRITFTFPRLPMKTAGGFTYVSLWSEYSPHGGFSPWVQRYDSNGAVLTCTATADVHFRTFDGLYYSSYGRGIFTYSRSTAKPYFEVQAKQDYCDGPRVPSDITCVCGVAMREYDIILYLNGCNGTLLAYGQNNSILPYGSGIFVDDSTNSYKIQMPSGNRVYIDYWGYIMNLRLVVIGQPQVQGLCGSPDGNSNNDLINRITNVTKPPVAGGFAGPQGPPDIVDSWWIDSGHSLFDGSANPSLESDRYAVNDVEAPSASTSITCSENPNNAYPGDPYRQLDFEPIFTLASLGNLDSLSSRRRRSVDSGLVQDQYDYSPISNAPRTKLIEVTWPTMTGITEQEANDTCWSLIVNTANLGPACMGMLMDSISDVQGVVTKCVLDVQLTSNFSWARDKVAELQKSCYFIAITKNRSDINDTNEAIQMAVTDVQQVIEFACAPYDCNGHGSCVNGTCNCSADYLGADCKVSKKATPTVSSFVTPRDCDIRNRPCTFATLRADNAASIPQLSCIVVVVLRNSTTITFIGTGQVFLAQSVTCDLPTDPLYYTSAPFNFTSAYDYGNSFYCLPPGSPVTAYTISVSNDGINFSNEITMRVVDTLCMICSTTSQICTQKPDTCLINGYCFNASDKNPYNNTQSCRPSFSTSFWSDQQGIAKGAVCRENEFSALDLTTTDDGPATTASSTTTSKGTSTEAAQGAHQDTTVSAFDSTATDSTNFNLATDGLFAATSELASNRALMSTLGLIIDADATGVSTEAAHQDTTVSAFDSTATATDSTTTDITSGGFSTVSSELASNRALSSTAIIDAVTPGISIEAFHQDTTVSAFDSTATATDSTATDITSGGFSTASSELASNRALSSTETIDAETTGSSIEATTFTAFDSGTTAATFMTSRSATGLNKTSEQASGLPNTSQGIKDADTTLIVSTRPHTFLMSGSGRSVGISLQTMILVLGSATRTYRRI